MSSHLSMAREIAYDAYVMVMTEKVHTREALERVYEAKGPKAKSADREFIKDVVFGSLRWHAKLYWILQNTSKRNLSETSPEVRAALICGTFQIYYMERVPDRVAVNESVEYVRNKGQASACSFINGILRQIARRAEYFAKPDKETKAVEYLALQFAHPEWMVRRWIKYFKFEKLEAMLAFHNQRPPTTARLNTLKTDVADVRLLQQQLLKNERVHSEKRPLRSALILKNAPQLGPESLYRQGLFSFQDEAAQLASLLVTPDAGETIAHGYTAAGKRLAHLWERSKGGAKLVAIAATEDDRQRSEEEIKRIDPEAKVEWHVGAFESWKPASRVNKVYLWAPSSEMGRLRRIPEQKYHFTESSLRAVVAEQAKLLDHALRQVRLGGELVYTVDSFEKEELENQLERLLKEHEGKIEVISPVSRLPDYYKRYVTRHNVFIVYTGNQDEMDGIGAFILRVNKEIG